MIVNDGKTGFPQAKKIPQNEVNRMWVAPNFRLNERFWMETGEKRGVMDLIPTGNVRRATCSPSGSNQYLP